MKIREYLKEMSKSKKIGAVLTSLVLVLCLSGAVFVNMQAKVVDAKEPLKTASTADTKKEALDKKEERTEKELIAKKADKKDEKKEDKKEESKKDTKEVSSKSAEDKKIASVDKKTSAKTEATTSNSGSNKENSGSAGNGGNTGNAGQSGNQGNASNKPSQKPDGVWVDAVYRTENVPEQGHYETRVVQSEWTETTVVNTAVVCYCGASFSDTDAVGSWGVHSQESGRGSACNGYSTQAVYGQIYHPALTEQVWVVDVPASTKQVLVSEGYWK